MKNEIGINGFKSFRLDQVILEIRTYNGVFLPTVAVDLWDLLEETLGEPILYEEQDGGFVCKLFSNTEISLTRTSFSIVEHFPDKSLERFVKVSSMVFEVVTTVLSTKVMPRVGFRLIYSVDFPEPEALTKAILESPFCKMPVGLSLETDGKPLVPSCTFGLTDGGKSMVYRLRGNLSKVALEVPIALSASGEFAESIEKTYTQFVFDVDVAITRRTKPGEFLVEEWIRQAYEAVVSDGKVFFGGGE